MTYEGEIMGNFSEKWQAFEKAVNERGGDGKATVAAMKDHYKLYTESTANRLGSLVTGEVCELN